MGLITLVFNDYVVEATETLEEKMKNDPDISQVNNSLGEIVVKVAEF